MLGWLPESLEGLKRQVQSSERTRPVEAATPQGLGHCCAALKPLAGWQRFSRHSSHGCSRSSILVFPSCTSDPRSESGAARSAWQGLGFMTTLYLQGRLGKIHSIFSFYTGRQIYGKWMVKMGLLSTFVFGEREGEMLAQSRHTWEGGAHGGGTVWEAQGTRSRAHGIWKGGKEGGRSVLGRQPPWL